MGTFTARALRHGFKLAKLTHAVTLVFGLAVVSHPAVANHIIVSVSGSQETVIPYDRFKCPTVKAGAGDPMTDVADSPLRMYKGEGGLLHAFTVSYYNFPFVGKSPLDLHRPSCTSMLRTRFLADPSTFQNREWLASTYAIDDKHVIAIIHNEYFGWRYDPGHCALPTATQRRCWYFSSTLAESSDGGYTFRRLPGDSAYLASPQERYSAAINTAGVGNPTNIFRNPHDNRYYVMLTVANLGACLGQSTDLRNWLFWDGSGFNGKFVNPFRARPAGTFSQGKRSTDSNDAYPCKPVFPTMSSVVYDPQFDVFIGVLNGGSRGIAYTSSKDLTSWAASRILIPNPSWPTGVIQYPSIIDMTSDSRNFDTVGTQPYVYFMSRPGRAIDRDIVRVPVKIASEP
jgi:hypothetical protein